MASLFRLSQRRIPALIALMAILMLFIAPEVSKTLEHRRIEAGDETSVGNLSEHSSEAMAGMDMDAMPMEQGNAHQNTSIKSADLLVHSGNHDPSRPHAVTSDDPGIMDDFACGYCQLLAHFPLLAWVFAPLLLLLLLTSRAPPLGIIPPYPKTFFPGLCQPRAPPAL